MQTRTYEPVPTGLYIQICTCEPVHTSLYIQICTYELVRASVYIQTCTYEPVRTNLYMQICTYGLARLCESPGLVWRIAIHKKRFLHIFIGVARERARVCIQIRHCTFMGYSSENAIPTHFQRVPPWPGGLYLLFAVILMEMSSCPGNASSARACTEEGSPIQVYAHAR